MSRLFQPKNKELIKLKVVPREEVWLTRKDKKGTQQMIKACIIYIVNTYI